MKLAYTWCKCYLRSYIPDDWWKAIDKCGVSQSLVQYGFQMLSDPTSSPSKDCVLSIFGNIHKNVRNRISNAKLVFLYQALRDVDELHYWIQPILWWA